MSRSYFEDVKEFHEKFGVEPTKLGNMLKTEDQFFRLNTLLEELQEYLNGISQHDYEMALDSLVDLIWFACGTAHVHGFDFDEAWKRVREANMAKVRATDASQSKRGTKLDIVKPEGWKPPDLSDLIKGLPSKDELAAAIASEIPKGGREC